MPKVLVVDDHHLIISGTLKALQKQYSNIEIQVAETAEDALSKIEKKLFFDLIILDIFIPKKTKSGADGDTGIQLIKDLLNKYPTQNIMVQSGNIKTLVRIKHEIDEHQGGFVIADKLLSEQDMLNRVDIAIKGGTHTIDIKNGVELKPKWYEVLILGCCDGLKDKAIAEILAKDERTVRGYWDKLADALQISRNNDKKEDHNNNMRMQIAIRAREEGLID